MKFAPRLAKAAVVVAIAFLASCAEKPLPVAVVPPQAPPPPPVALSRMALEAASAYRTYVIRASQISPAFADGSAVSQSVSAGAAYEAKQFLRGSIAYGALVALQSPQFVAGVRTYAIDPVQRRDLAARLIRDPNYASALPSAANAAGLVSTALAMDASKVRRAGELVKQAAYDVQKQKWSKGEVAGRDARLASAKAVSAQMIVPPTDDVDLLQRAVNGRDSAGVSVLAVESGAMSPPYTAVVNRALALAAIAALGEVSTPGNETALDALLDENASAFCYNMGKLNLYQCLSVAKPYYEDVFCLGQHILLDTAQCMAKAAGTPPPQALAVATPPGASAVVSTKP